MSSFLGMADNLREQYQIPVQGGGRKVSSLLDPLKQRFQKTRPLLDDGRHFSFPRPAVSSQDAETGYSSMGLGSTRSGKKGPSLCPES